MNTQKFFSILGESFLNALVFLLIFNGFTAWGYIMSIISAPGNIPYLLPSGIFQECSATTFLRQ